MTDNVPQKRKGCYSEDHGSTPRKKKAVIRAAYRSPTESSTNSTQSVDISPMNFPFALRILKRYQAKEYAEALSLVDQFYNLPKTHPQYRKEDSRAEFQIIQATCYNALGIKQVEANILLQNVLDKDPNNSFALYALGVMLYNNGDFRGSIKIFDKAISLNAASMQRAMEYRAKAATLTELVNSANDDYKHNRLYQMIETLRIAKKVEPTNLKICQTIEKVLEFFMYQVVRRLENDVLCKQQEDYETTEKLITGYKLKEARPLIENIRSEVPRTGEGAFLVGFYDYMRGEISEATKYFAEAIHLDNNSEKYKEYYDKAIETEIRLLEIGRQMSNQDFLPALLKLNLPEIDDKNLVVKQLMHLHRGQALMLLNREEDSRVELMKYCQLTPIVGNIIKHVLSGISVEDEKKVE